MDEGSNRPDSERTPEGRDSENRSDDQDLESASAASGRPTSVRRPRRARTNASISRTNTEAVDAGDARRAIKTLGIRFA
jgi:hypothetical protein